MTAREMQVEFERRIIALNPAFEYKEKLTSDTIFSFLNAFVERFVREAYLRYDQSQDGTHARSFDSNALKNLLVSAELEKTNTDVNFNNHIDTFNLPSDYLAYVSSTSKISQTYKGKISGTDNYRTIPNILIDAQKVNDVISTPYNKAIIRTPYAVINSGKSTDKDNIHYLNIIRDAYTVIESLELTYYRLPKKFNTIGVDGNNVLSYCELPENIHMLIVEGAVDMFITENKYRLNTNTSKE